MRHIFRKIDFADFTDPQPNPVPPPDDSQQVARTTSDGASSSQLTQHALAVLGVWLRDGNGNDSNVYVYETDRNHPRLPRHQARFLFRVAGPGDPAIAANDRVTVCWRLRARKGVLRGKLELFVAGSPVAVWERELSDAELRQAPQNAQPGDQVQGTIFGGLEWDGSFDPADLDPAHQAAFTAGHLLARKSPYKLKLTISTAKRRSKTPARQAWTYFDVPAWHKYKLASYVPSTNLGCFGLEFDPEEPIIKVFSKVFTIAEQYEEAYQRSAAERRAEFAAACERAWGDQFELHRGGVVGRSWRVALRVEDVGGTTSQVDDKTLAGHERAIAEQVGAQRVHLCLVLKPKTGGSGLASAAKNPYANIFLFERSAFDTHHPGNVGRDVIVGELEALHAELSARFPPGGGGVATVANQPPTLEIPFAPGGAVLGGAEAAALQQVAAMVAARRATCAIPVYVTATGNPAGPLETQRAAAVHGALQPHLPGGHALVQGTADDPVQQRVIVRIGYRDLAERNALDQVPVAYNAAVHEFGHGFGLVDEYMDYAASPAFAGVAAGQARMLALCQAHGLPEWPRPEGRNCALMSVGSQVHKRYYLPLWEAVAAVVGLEERRLDNHWTIQDRANNNPLPPVVESPDFAPLVRCLEVVEARARRNKPSSRKLFRALRDEIAAQGLTDRVAYKRLVERDNPQQNVRPNLFAADQHCLVGFGVWRGNTLLHAATCVQIREVAPIVEVTKYKFRTNLGLNPPNFELYPQAANKRHPVLLRSSHPFTGHGILTCDQDGVEVYRTRQGGAPCYERQANPAGLRLRGAELSRGVKVYVRGLTANTVLSLALHSQRCPTRAAAETARIGLPAGPSLRVHPCSLIPGEVPPALATIGMKGQELFVPLTPGPLPGLAARCLVVVHRPAGTVGKLFLRVNPGCSFHKTATGRKRVSKKVKRRINGGPKIEYQEVKLGRSDFDAGGLRSLWLQGNAVSPAIGAWQIALIDENDAEVASCKVCVTAVHAVTVQIPATPALTARLLPADNQPQDQVFRPDVEAAHVPGATGVLRDLDFATNPPLVLIAGSAAPLRPPRVVVRIHLDVGKHMSLVLERAADDAARLRTGGVEPYPLELAQIGADNGDGTHDIEFRLPREHVGSFHLRVRAGGSTLAVLNYVGVGAAAVLPNGQAKPKTGAVAQFAQQAQAMQEGFLVAHTGSVPFPDPQHHDLDYLRANACTRHVGRVQLTGGGPDGKRGLDRVFAGWIQNKTAGRLEADYTDFRGGGGVHTARGEMVSNQGAAGILWQRDRGFVQGGAAPVPLAPAVPLLDTGRVADGGMTATLGGRKLERDDTVAFGHELVAVAVDSPGTEFPARHRSHADALLTRARYDLTFRAYLCVWTDMSRRDAGGGTGDRLYGVVGHFQWKVEGRWTVAWPVNVQGFDNDDRRQNPDWWQTAVITAAAAFRAKRTKYYTYERARPAEGVVEVRPPTPLQVFAWDFS